MSEQNLPQNRKSVQLVYRNRPEVPETYVDLLRLALAEGTNIKMEFVVNRQDQPSTSDATITGQSITACRLIIPVQGMVDMAAKLNDLLTKLRSAGIVKTISEGSILIN